MRQSRRFDASSPVTRYWLAHCVGFSLSGGGRGTVERVLADDDPYDPTVLEVRTGRSRVRRLPTSAVIAVVPSEQVLVVDRRHRLTPDRKRDASVRLRWTARVLWRGLYVAATLVTVVIAEAFHLGRRAWVGGSPVVARTSSRGVTGAARLVRSVQ
jgi:anti-sigma-K factor RskA